jgi:outer membrane immunogenic protein
VKKLLLLGTALVAFADAGLAADLGPYRPGSIKDEPVPIYAPVFSWTGFYVGAQVGYAWGETEFHNAIDKFGFDQDGWFGGGFVGFNWQKDRFVFGIEGDANAANIEHSELFTAPAPDVRFTSSIDALYSIRGRICFAHDRWLIFATGGWAWASVEDTVDFIPGSKFSEDDTIDGWTLGGGLEYAFTPNWTARVEYRHYDFDESKLTTPGYKRELDLDTVSVGVAYKF